MRTDTQTTTLRVIMKHQSHDKAKPLEQDDFRLPLFVTAMTVLFTQILRSQLLLYR